MEVNKASRLARRILEADTPYIKGRSLIQSECRKLKGEVNEDHLVHLITLIDVSYSTNMNKRLFGISDVAEALCSQGNTLMDLAEKFSSYIDSPSSSFSMNALFESKYGINKNGTANKRAWSVISKFGYFITNFKFPIYDSLVTEMYPYFTGEKISQDAFQNFASDMIKFKRKESIESFGVLDNLLWLMGKINKGSFSLLLNKQNYILMLNKISEQKNVSLRDCSSLQVDKHIRDFVFTDPQTLEGIFSKELIEIIEYTISLQRKQTTIS